MESFEILTEADVLDDPLHSHYKSSGVSVDAYDFDDEINCMCESCLEEAKEYTCNHINCSCIYCDKILLAYNDQNDKKAEKIIKSINTDYEMETESKKKK